MTGILVSLKDLLPLPPGIPLKTHVTKNKAETAKLKYELNVAREQMKLLPSIRMVLGNVQANPIVHCPV